MKNDCLIPDKWFFIFLSTFLFALSQFLQ